MLDGCEWWFSPCKQNKINYTLKNDFGGDEEQLYFLVLENTLNIEGDAYSVKTFKHGCFEKSQISCKLWQTQSWVYKIEKGPNSASDDVKIRILYTHTVCQDEYLPTRLLWRSIYDGI